MSKINGQSQYTAVYKQPESDTSQNKAMPAARYQALCPALMKTNLSLERLNDIQIPYPESPTELNTMPDTESYPGSQQDLPEEYRSGLNIDEDTMAMARDICRDIQSLVTSSIDFDELQMQKASSQSGQKYPLKESTYKKYNNTDVAEYRDRSGYPSKSLDKRPAYFNMTNLCGHGTNLTAIISALLHSNCQIVPGIKARKLGIKMIAGESRGTRPLNQKFVSTVGLGFLSSRIHDARDYAFNAVQNKSTRISDTIAAIALGDGIDEGFVRSDIKNEQVFKRLNIRGIAVAKEHFSLTVAIKEILNAHDILVFDMNDFIQSKRPNSFEEMQGIDLQGIWSRGL